VTDAASNELRFFLKGESVVRITLHFIVCCGNGREWQRVAGVKRGWSARANRHEQGEEAWCLQQSNWAGRAINISASQTTSLDKTTGWQ
jgi:hypothetical protein